MSVDPFLADLLDTHNVALNAGGGGFSATITPDTQPGFSAVTVLPPPAVNGGGFAAPPGSYTPQKAAPKPPGPFDALAGAIATSTQTLSQNIAADVQTGGFILLAILLIGIGLWSISK